MIGVNCLVELDDLCGEIQSIGPVCPICKAKMKPLIIKHFEDPEIDNWEEALWECSCKPNDWNHGFREVIKHHSIQR